MEVLYRRTVYIYIFISDSVREMSPLLMQTVWHHAGAVVLSPPVSNHVHELFCSCKKIPGRSLDLLNRRFSSFSLHFTFIQIYQFYS